MCRYLISNTHSQFRKASCQRAVTSANQSWSGILVTNFKRKRALFHSRETLPSCSYLSEEMIYRNYTPSNDSSSNNTETFERELLAALPAAITSLILGIVALLSNGVLLLSLLRDPLKCFKARRTTVFILCLACADFQGGLIVQLSYSASMLCRVAAVAVPLLYNIGYIGSHLGTKISVLTVVAMSVDRYMAVKLALKYRRIVTVRRIAACNACTWLFTICFEASHSLIKDEQEFQTADLHIQTTFHLTVLSVVYLATYLDFRR